MPQEGFLFNGTILENVRLARPAPPTTRCEPPSTPSACGSASPSSPRASTPRCGAGVAAVGGRKQLVSLARAALADPRSSCSTRPRRASTRYRGRRRARHGRLMEGRTVIVIAHRLSTAERADLVGVVADGRLLELGTHDGARGPRATAPGSSTWTGGPPADVGPRWSGGIEPAGIVTIAVGEIPTRRKAAGWLSPTSTSRSTSSAGATPRTTSSSPRRASTRTSSARCPG